ncbi:MAG: DUF6975 family protein [Allosphingosinicella sp.]|uniref:DUF6975 family protein n=1 Tax=Allosphingosinicella sp. TaxID=2823234 RepID=UPI00394EFB4E
MASHPIGLRQEARSGCLLIDCVDDHGSRSHAYPTSDLLLTSPTSPRNLADAIHFLCAVHGQYPSLVELVAARTIDPPSRAWLAEAGDEFSRERAFLARLSVEAGPIPPTPGSGSEAAIAATRHALATLAKSERRGCSLGAALAVAADWVVVRTVLDTAAERLGVTPPPRSGDHRAAIVALVEGSASDPAMGRAMRFGAEQVALQHRGLWDLLQARAQARIAA